MKKKIFVGLFMISLVFVAFYGVLKTKNGSEMNMSFLTIENLEALAQIEGPISNEDYIAATGCSAVSHQSDCRGRDGYLYSYSVSSRH